MRASPKRFVYILMLMLSVAMVVNRPLFASEQDLSSTAILLLKKDTLDLVRDMKTLENQIIEAKGEAIVSVFFSIKQKALTVPSTLQLQLDNQTILRRSYSKKDLQDLSDSGGHQVYEMQVKPGRHTLQASMQNHQITHVFNQAVTANVLQITLGLDRDKSLKFSIEEW